MAFFKYPTISSPTKATGTSTSFTPREILELEKKTQNCAGSNPCMVPYVHVRPSLVGCLFCRVFAYIRTSTVYSDVWFMMHLQFFFLFYIFHICAMECTLTRVHISVFVCVWVAVGEQGGAKDPDVVASALLQHMAMGAKGSRHDRESLGT